MRNAHLFFAYIFCVLAASTLQINAAEWQIRKIKQQQQLGLFSANANDDCYRHHTLLSLRMQTSAHIDKNSIFVIYFSLYLSLCDALPCNPCGPNIQSESFCFRHSQQLFAFIFSFFFSLGCSTPNRRKMIWDAGAGAERSPSTDNKKKWRSLSSLMCGLWRQYIKHTKAGSTAAAAAATIIIHISKQNEWHRQATVDLDRWDRTRERSPK